MTDQNFAYVNPDATEAPAVEPVVEEEDLFSSEETANFVAPDPNAVIILRFSTGDSKYVPANEPMALGAVMARAQLAAIPGAVTYYLNGTEISADAIIPLGQTVTVIGSVKGG